MKLTLQMQVLPDADQKATLLATMERFNRAATFAAKVGFEAGVYSQPSIHKRCYAEIRGRFGLSAQLAVRAIGKAVEAFATLKAKGRKECPTFRPRGAVTYDERILSFKGLDKVSLWTLAGRMILPLAYGEYQGQRFDRIKGQVDLIYRGGKFFLYTTVDLPEDVPIAVEDFLGVDLGIVNLATDSEGTTYTGEAVEKVRRRHHRNRKKLQSKGTRGANKRLKKLAGREGRFRRHVNHCISKSLVSKAKDTACGIAVEELTGIRQRNTVRARDRARHSGWAFFQMRSFLEYKAALAGIPVVKVDPRNTSRTCSACGHCAKGNRKTRDRFECQHCKYSANADFNAAQNLRVLGLGRHKPASELASLTA
jgi:IS605 OrfB family transposase